MVVEMTMFTAALAAGKRSLQHKLHTQAENVAAANERGPGRTGARIVKGLMAAALPMILQRPAGRESDGRHG